MQVDEQVDVDQLTSASTQTANPPAFARQEEYSEHANPINATIPAKKFDYEAYSSLFAWYPMLRSVSGNPSTSASSSPASTSSRSLTSHPISDTRDIPSIDFDTLRLRSVLTYLDPSKQLCRYEVPGGGECRDDQCEDVHLSKLGQGGGVVPSASYVLESLPSPWLKEHGITCARIVQAVEQVRNKNPAMGFEDCVIHALYSIGQPPPT
ncbi:hypothetical protein AX16_007960 [Volvariella volvacea WC 439]|nr:hypothetical protein AX16_007960 [Volvariella volvacea WC 439]